MVLQFCGKASSKIVPNLSPLKIQRYNFYIRGYFYACRDASMSLSASNCFKAAKLTWKVWDSNSRSILDQFFQMKRVFFLPEYEHSNSRNARNGKNSLLRPEKS